MTKEPQSDTELAEADREYLNWRIERRQRARVAFIVVPAIAGLLVMLGATLIDRDYFYNYSPFPQPTLVAVSISLLAFSGIGVLMLYLQTGFRRSSSTARDRDAELRLLRTVRDSSTFNETRLIALERRLEELASAFEDARSSAHAVTPHDRQQLVASLAAQIRSEAATEILTQIQSEITDQRHEDERLTRISALFRGTIDRLSRELEALGFRGNLNLALGIATTAAGLGVLAYFVFTQEMPTEPEAFAAFFLPRLSLVVFIELFAYFFLRLYKASLGEIKYFQNEITNVEARLVALTASLSFDTPDLCGDVIRSLSSTERNFILDQGQTTIELERAKLDTQAHSGLLDRLAAIVNRKD